MPYAKPKEHQKLIIKRPTPAVPDFPRGTVTPLKEFQKRLRDASKPSSISSSFTSPRFGDTRGTTSADSVLADSIAASHAGNYSQSPAVACLGPAPDAPIFTWGKIEGEWDDNGTEG